MWWNPPTVTVPPTDRGDCGRSGGLWLLQHDWQVPDPIPPEESQSQVIRGEEVL